jgi:hypothetical protein
MSKVSAIDTAKAAWGESIPEWVLRLAEECDKTTQAAVSRVLDVSAAMVNCALKNTYKGDLQRLEARVKGQYLRATVTCPVLGEVTLRQCQDEQAAPFTTANFLRVMLNRACRDCPHGKGAKQ